MTGNRRQRHSPHGFPPQPLSVRTEKRSPATTASLEFELTATRPVQMRVSPKGSAISTRFRMLPTRSVRPRRQTGSNAESSWCSTYSAIEAPLIRGPRRTGSELRQNGGSTRAFLPTFRRLLIVPIQTSGVGGALSLEPVGSPTWKGSSDHTRRHRPGPAPLASRVCGTVR
jgi:hypothetical protein